MTGAPRSRAHAAAPALHCTRWRSLPLARCSPSRPTTGVRPPDRDARPPLGGQPRLSLLAAVDLRPTSASPTDQLRRVIGTNGLAVAGSVRLDGRRPVSTCRRRETRWLNRLGERGWSRAATAQTSTLPGGV